MANVINNYLLALGSTKELSKLRKFLENKDKAIDLLSYGEMGIYRPSKTRKLGDDGFGEMPGPFASEVSVWDIAAGKQKLSEVSSKPASLEYFLDYYDWAMDEVEDILFFCVQSRYSEPSAGFLMLAKEFPELKFIWRCDGEFMDAVCSKTFEYENGELTDEDIDTED